MTETRCHFCNRKISPNPEPDTVYGGIDFRLNLLCCWDCVGGTEWKKEEERQKEQKEKEKGDERNG